MNHHSFVSFSVSYMEIHNKLSHVETLGILISHIVASFHLIIIIFQNSYHI